MNWTEEELQNYQRRMAEFKREGVKLTAQGDEIHKGIQGEGRGIQNGLRGEFGRSVVLSEEVEQVALARYLDMMGVRWFHAANGGKRNVVVAKKLKSAGVKPGVPDIIIIDIPPNYPTAPGAVIELKRTRGGVVSPEQEDWLQHFEAHGWCCCVAKGAADGIRFLRELGW